jgi:hypothetical protein
MAVLAVGLVLLYKTYPFETPQNSPPETGVIHIATDYSCRELVINLEDVKLFLCELK